MMLYMKVTDAHWLAFGTLASLKLKGGIHRKYAHNMATGQLYFVLRESLINAIQTTSTLKMLVVALGGNCGEEIALQEQRDRCSRLLEVALAINGFRADSLREHDSSYPMRFALVLSDSLEQQRAAVRSFKEDFHFLLQIEERARGDDGLLEVLRHVVWRQDPFVRLLFMLWDRPRGDEIDSEALELTKNVRPPGRLERGVQSTLQTKHRLPILQCLLRDTRSVRVRHGRYFTASKVGHDLGARYRKFVCGIAICFKALASSA